MDSKTNNIINILYTNIKKGKITSARFRDTLIKTLEQYESKTNKLKIVNKKIVLNQQFYMFFIDMFKIAPDDKIYYKEFDKLLNKRLIHKKSSMFPKNLRLISINPNQYCFFVGSLQDISVYKNAEKEVLDHINELDYLYCYLYYFHSYMFSKKLIEQFNVKNLIVMPNNKGFISLQDESIIDNNKYNTLYPLDKIITQALVNHKNVKGSLFTNTHENFTKSFRVNKLNSMNHFIIKSANRKSQFFESTGVELSLNSKIIPSVGVSLSDLKNLPCSKEITIPQHLIDKEDDFLKDYKKSSYGEKEDIEEDDENIYFDMYEIENLSLLIRKKENEFKKEELEYAYVGINEYKDRYLGNKTFQIYLDYIIHILKRLETKEIQLSTTKNYLGLINKHLFRKVYDIYNVEQNYISKYIEYINGNNYSSIDTLITHIKDFFNFSNQNNIDLDINFDHIFYPKSLVYKHEINQILEQIEDNISDITIFKNKSKNIKDIILTLKMMILYGFYFGLRKTELISRLNSDTILLKNNVVMVDVNRDGLKRIGQKLKTVNAKRRIKSIISDEHHMELFEKWFEFISLKKENEFIFNSHNKKELQKVHCANDSMINYISNILKKITRRNCSFHSLRHSYATYEYKRLMKMDFDDTYKMLKLAIRLGHSTSEITFKSYVHYYLLDYID